MSNFNREEFLAHLAKKMGRDLKTIPDPVPENEIKLPQTRYTELTTQKLCQKFIDIAKEIGITIHLVNHEKIADIIPSLLEKYPGNIIAHDDPQLSTIVQAIKNTNTTIKVWNPSTEDNLLQYSESCGLGIINAIHGFADGAGIAVESSKLHGRSVSLLPRVSMVQVKTSTILPRIYQYAEQLSVRAQKGERMPSVINIITGPSSTADIELIKVIGVHGPMEMVILLVDDLNLELTI